MWRLEPCRNDASRLPPGLAPVEGAAFAATASLLIVVILRPSLVLHAAVARVDPIVVLREE